MTELTTEQIKTFGLEDKVEVSKDYNAFIDEKKQEVTDLEFVGLGLIEIKYQLISMKDISCGRYKEERPFTHYCLGKFDFAADAEENNRIKCAPIAYFQQK